MPAKIYLDEIRISSSILRRGDQVYVTSLKRKEPVHCYVSETKKKNGKIIINFEEVGNHPDRLIGNHRQKGVISISILGK